MQLTPISFGGFTFGSAYKAIIPEDAPASWRATVNENRRTGAFPQFASVEFDGISLPVMIQIVSGSLLTLKRVFNAAALPLGPRKLVVEDEEGGQWSVMAVAQNLVQTSQKKAVAMLRVSEPVWVSETLGTETWLPSEGDLEITIGTDNFWALPVLKITPTGANPNHYAHNEPITVLNVTSQRAMQLPIQLVTNWDTATLVGAGQLQASCADVRVLVDGVEVDAWVNAPNTSGTDLWINLDLEGKTELGLGEDLASSGAIGEVLLAKGSTAAMKKLPKAGAFLVDDEIFTYDGVDAVSCRLGGVVRAQRNTTSAAHTKGDTVYFIQHDIRLLWGNATAEARVNDETKRPAFELSSSTNGQWVYAQFGDRERLMGGAWKPSVKSAGGVSNIYTEELNAYDDVWPAKVLGGEILTYTTSRGKLLGDTATLTWDFYHPFTIYSVAGTGKKWRTGAKWPTFALQKSANGTAWKPVASEISPVNESEWVDFTIAETTTGAGANYAPTWLRVSLAGVVAASTGAAARAEMRDVTVKMVTANLPRIIRGTEIGNVQLEGTISNLATDEAVEISYPAAVGKTLTVDGVNKTITYDGRGAAAAMAQSPERVDWLRLVPGLNRLRYAGDSGGPVSIVVEWRERMVW